MAKDIAIIFQLIISVLNKSGSKKKGGGRQITTCTEVLVYAFLTPVVVTMWLVSILRRRLNRVTGIFQSSQVILICSHVGRLLADISENVNNCITFLKTRYKL